MALGALSGDEQCIIFSQLCNPLDPGVAVAFGSISSELWALTPALLQQLRADYEVVTTLSRKLGMRSCKELREAKKVEEINQSISAAELALLGTLGSVLPALEELRLYKLGSWEAGHGWQAGKLAEKLGAGALPAVTLLRLSTMHVGDAGASALAAALGRGALPRLKHLHLTCTAIGDAGLVALASALRRLPALEVIYLSRNPFGDEGLAALVAPPPPAGALSPPAGVLKKLKELYFSYTKVTDAGCAALTAALDRGALPVLEVLYLDGIPASDASKAALKEALELNGTEVFFNHQRYRGTVSPAKAVAGLQGDDGHDDDYSEAEEEESVYSEEELSGLEEAEDEWWAQQRHEASG